MTAADLFLPGVLFTAFVVLSAFVFVEDAKERSRREVQESIDRRRKPLVEYRLLMTLEKLIRGKADVHTFYALKSSQILYERLKEDRGYHGKPKHK